MYGPSLYFFPIECFDKNSPTQRVGSDVLEGFVAVAHKYKMLSLGNTYSEKDLIDFDTRLKKLTDKPIKYTCELKYDGVSISLTYKNGKLIQALTRGDGMKGDDVFDLSLNSSFPNKDILSMSILSNNSVRLNCPVYDNQLVIQYYWINIKIESSKKMINVAIEDSAPHTLVLDDKQVVDLNDNISMFKSGEASFLDHDQI